ncbi:MAG: efflux RND transporter periplasmic adaptor subunit [Pseudomonadota bacterium]
MKAPYSPVFRYIAGTGIGLLTVVAVILLNSTPAANSAEAKPAAVEPALLLVAADLVTVDIGSVAQGIRVTGTLEPLNRTTVNARLSAVVDSVLVREGESVRKGQVLMRQNSADVAAQLQRAEAQLASARVELRLMEEYEAKKAALYEKKYLSEFDWSTARGDTELKRSLVKIQEANVVIARKAVDDTAILAPIGGIVAERYVQPGSNVMPGQVLMSLVDLSQLELAADIPARDINQIHVGGDVTFTVDGQPNRTFHAKVVRINPMANGGARTITLYARVDNRDGVLKGGMFANGRVVTGNAARGKVLRIPASAVRDIDGKRQVWVIRDNKLALQPVTLGIRDSGTGLIEVKQGLAAGERVILTNIGQRIAGMPVSVADAR